MPFVIRIIKMKSVSLQTKLLVISMLAWFACVLTISVRWNYSLANDCYQYAAPFAFNSPLFQVKLPMMNGFMPFSGSWGVQWPLLMEVKSVLYSIIPFSLWADFSFLFSFSLLTCWILFKNHLKTGGSAWVALLFGLAILADRVMLHKVFLERSEVIVSLLLLFIVLEADSKNERKSFLRKSLPYILLPLLHPIGMMIAGGLALMQLIFPGIVFGARANSGRFTAISGFCMGILLLAAYFLLQPDAMAQMKMNLQVQSAIYNGATRYTYFLNYLAEYPYKLGYLTHGVSFIIALRCLFTIGLNSLRKGTHIYKSSTILSSAIVLGMPIIGFIFRTDNYFHFVIAAPSSLFLLGQWAVEADKSNKRRVRELAVGVVIGLFAMTNLLVPANRFYKFMQAGMPNHFEERVAILETYKDARRIYVPPNMWAEAARAFPNKAVSYKFPMPMLVDVRKKYEDFVYSDVMPGDILIVEERGILKPQEDRFGGNPIGSFSPPTADQWKHVANHKKLIPGRVITGWDLMVYEKQ